MGVRLFYYNSLGFSGVPDVGVFKGVLASSVIFANFWLLFLTAGGLETCVDLCLNTNEVCLVAF
jgi:hypothetical protein